MTPDSNQSSSKLAMASSSQNSEQLLQELMAAQEVKNPQLAAKQARLIQMLRENSMSEMPSA